jgi:DNA-binding transcriptional ArsR family regulator
MVNDPRTLVTASSAPSASTSSPSFPRPLTDPAANLIVGRLRVLGQPLRVKLVDRLAAEATTVQELVDALGTTQQNISQHLRLLRRAGVVARRKEGTPRPLPSGRPRHPHDPRAGRGKPGSQCCVPQRAEGSNRDT